MSKFLLATLLLLMATAALAGNPPTPADASGKAGKPARPPAVTDLDAAAPHQASVPAHAVRTPRWHSLLPGMIR